MRNVIPPESEDPGDAVSLETLWHAYSKVGDAISAKLSLIRLAKLVVREKNIQKARDILPSVAACAADDDEARQLLAQLRDLSDMGW